MAKTGKHPTNIAGEWRNNDLVYDKFCHDKIFVFAYDKKIKKYIITKDSALITYYEHLASLQANYINITEMQRALGRL